MKKKFLIIISSILCFVGLAFLITMRSSMPVLALGNVAISDNDTFSNDLLIDLDYYESLDDNTINLISCPTTGEATNDWQAKLLCYAKINHNTRYYYNFSYNKSGGNGNGGMAVYLTKNMPPLTLSNWFPDTPSNATRITINEDSNANVHLNANSGSYNYIAFYIGRTNDTSRKNFTNIKISLYNSNRADYVAYYSKMFGFSIHSDDSSIISGLEFVEYIPNLGNTYYLPFNIASNGKVSFNYTFPVGANVDFHKIVIKNKINGVVNDKIKLQYSYSNFSLGYKSITFIDDTPSSGDNWYGLIFQSDPPQVKIQSGKSSVYYANFKNQVYSYLYASDFIDHTDYLYYSQVLGFGSYASATNGKRTISFESLVCSSFGSGGGIVIPDNPDNEYEVYKEVTGPFDFTTMIYNAFTWIIFNVPVIGPVLNVLRSARVMFSSVVSIGQLFTGFGVIFSIFIVCLILYIIKHLNGGD